MVNTDWDAVFTHRLMEDPNGCWLWQGSIRTGRKYGTVGFRSKIYLAHRLSWKLAFGEVPESLCVCHICDVPACVRPDHLFLGTHQENMRDMMAKGRQRSVTGDAHYSRREPERLARGDQNGSRLHPEKMPKGEDHGMVILTEELVLEIRAARAAGEKLKPLAYRYGVAECTISAIAHRRLWKHI